jgi:hypothetical protein
MRKAEIFESGIVYRWRKRVLYRIANDQQTNMTGQLLPKIFERQHTHQATWLSR